MKYVKTYEQYGAVTESIEVDSEEVLHRIQNSPGGCSLKELLEAYPDPAQIMTALDTLTNHSAIELTGGKYKAVKTKNS